MTLPRGARGGGGPPAARVLFFVCVVCVCVCLCVCVWCVCGVCVCGMCVWCVCVCVCLVCVCVCRFLWLPHVALVLFRCMFRRLLVAEVSFFRMGLPLVSLWLGGGGSGRAGLSAPRLPPHHPALRPKRGFRKGSCQLPVGGRWPTPYSKIAMLDTEKARSACQVIPKVGVVTLCGCRKPGANLHQPGIEPGSHRWQRCILPLDH